MDGPVVAGHTQQARVRVEVDTEDLGGVGAATKLTQEVAVPNVKHSDQCPLFTSRRQSGACKIGLQHL